MSEISKLVPWVVGGWLAYLILKGAGSSTSDPASVPLVLEPAPVPAPASQQAASTNVAEVEPEVTKVVSPSLTIVKNAFGTFAVAHTTEGRPVLVSAQPATYGGDAPAIFGFSWIGGTPTDYGHPRTRVFTYRQDGTGTTADIKQWIALKASRELAKYLGVEPIRIEPDMIPYAG